MRNLLIIGLFLINLVVLSQNNTDTKNVKNQKKTSATELTEEEFEVKLKNLETDVNLLKEKIFRSKARLSTLQETLISGKSIKSAKLIINHVNKFSHFKVNSVVYHLDGKPLWAYIDTDGTLSKMKTKVLYNGVVIPGNHMLSVVIKLEINEMGLFDYSSGYQFKIKASHSFHIEAGKVTSINVNLREKGGYFNKITEKPDILFKAGISKDLTVTDVKKK